ncbi:hypothetical protein DXB25_05515 [Lachnospiraceae bacterium OM02-31]|nr:hypothetical protein DXB25_05515 [Lachnospiraceae bacterium OM02-31]RJW58521.1 hypothetical protein DXB24_04730 [Lachnospiraceae bacterium OM02-3]
MASTAAYVLEFIHSMSFNHACIAERQHFLECFTVFYTYTAMVKRVLSHKRLINCGFYDLATAYQSVHVNY